MSEGPIVVTSETHFVEPWAPGVPAAPPGSFAVSRPLDADELGLQAVAGQWLEAIRRSRAAATYRVVADAADGGRLAVEIALPPALVEVSFVVTELGDEDRMLEGTVE